MMDYDQGGGALYDLINGERKKARKLEEEMMEVQGRKTRVPPRIWTFVGGKGEGERSEETHNEDLKGVRIRKNQGPQRNLSRRH